jgi:quinol monooxygenase YgiN
MPRGGARPNSGPKKGAKYGPQQQTISKVAAREAVRAAIARHADALVEAQIANAKGLQYLVYRNKKSGKFERVKALEDVDQDENTIEVWEKDPSVQAFTDLLNRYLDKPKEQEQEVAVTGKLVVEIAKAW